MIFESSQVCPSIILLFAGSGASFFASMAACDSMPFDTDTNEKKHWCPGPNLEIHKYVGIHKYTRIIAGSKSNLFNTEKTTLAVVL